LCFSGGERGEEGADISMVIVQLSLLVWEFFSLEIERKKNQILKAT